MLHGRSLFLSQQVFFQHIEKKVCGVCYKELSGAKLLPCQHTFCCSCLIQYVNPKMLLDCPKCRNVCRTYIVNLCYIFLILFYEFLKIKHKHRLYINILFWIFNSFISYCNTNTLYLTIMKVYNWKKTLFQWTKQKGIHKRIWILSMQNLKQHLKKYRKINLQKYVFLKKKLQHSWNIMYYYYNTKIYFSSISVFENSLKRFKFKSN